MGDIQIHTLVDGSTVEIERKKSGKGHRYLLNGSKPVGSVTSILGHLDSDAFGIGMRWALKQARLADGDLDAPKRIGDTAREAGDLLHKQIEDFIKNGTVEEDLAFLAWHSLMDGLGLSEELELIATERFVYDPELLIGGTVDCIVRDSTGKFHIYDWKTKELNENGEYRAYPREFAQLAGYVHALRAMNSEWAPSKAYIVYVMRDGSKADRVEVPLGKYIPIYKATWQLHDLLGR
ncbi:PD-(D/E)XK nuclease family protein [Candidatus Pacearchaeota archaeon]|nr:PD-(D/E)XK nuclease family protein [Candidatus Pacearchaeota archaeon]